MADQVSEILEAPREFVKDGMQFSTALPIIFFSSDRNV
jgi:hypothetical protein